MDALVARIAHLEGAFEQIDKRLTALEHRLDEGFRALNQRLDANSRWLIAIILANWVTLMLAILLRR